MMKECPVCLKMFTEHVIETHAALCGVPEQPPSPSSPLPNIDEAPSCKSMHSELGEVKTKLENAGLWKINIVLSRFMETAMDELCDTVEYDWEKNFRVSFIGEDGVDCSDLTREFFTLLFKNCPIFENKTFKLDLKLLAEMTYFLFGKATAYAVINGHPCPRLLNKVLSNYLCSSKEPKTSDFDIRDLNRADVEAAIEEVSVP
jgi:hypothetical protein